MKNIDWITKLPLINTGERSKYRLERGGESDYEATNFFVLRIKPIFLRKYDA